MRILLAQINPIIGDIEGNTEKILQGIKKGHQSQAELILFPELCITGYPPEDFLLLPHFIEAAQAALQKIIQKCIGITAVVGLPRYNPDQKEKGLFNSAAIIQNQTLIGFQDKMLLPTYDVFDESRYFERGSGMRIWNLLGKAVAITICEDIWQHSALLKDVHYRCDPISDLQPFYPDIVLNISASPYSFGKLTNRLKVGTSAASTLMCPIVLCNQVGGNDSLIYDGHSFYINSKGNLINIAKGFEEDFLLVDLDQEAKPHPFLSDPIEDLYKALVLGVRDYFRKSEFKKACLGLSGGIDSALVAAIAAEALGSENVLGVIMPSRYSSEGSVKDALQLAKNLNIQTQTLSIESPFQSYLELLSPSFENKPLDSTEENLQARIRGMILMALSNKLGYIVLSTGNKSELAMGYATLYGDMCGGLGVINDITKMQVYALSHWINRQGKIIPQSTIDKPPSAELHYNQKDSDSLPPYEIIDNIVESYIENHQTPHEIIQKFGYSKEGVMDVIHRIHRNEYKRRQSAPGLRVTEKAFSIGRRFPIVQRFA
jgi:NAD+ synthase (glutamine-hydrolysing)